MWTDLVSAYEEKIEVLEEARNGFARALDDVMTEVERALDLVAQTSSAAAGNVYAVGQ